MPDHTVSALLGLGTFLLVVAAIAESFGYLSPSVLGALTPTNLGALAVLAFIAAVAVHWLEGRDEGGSFSSRKFRRGNRGGG